MAKSRKLEIFKSTGFWFTTGFFFLLAIGVGLAWSYKDEIHPDTPFEVSPIDTIRNVGLVIGGVLAFVFAWWRALVAERQTDAAKRQVETAQNQADIALRALSNERYQRGAEMLGSPVLAVRLGGIYALQQLASDHPNQYHVQVMCLFCAFVRNPTKDDILDKPDVIEGEVMPQRIREDAQAALYAIGRRNRMLISLEDEEGFKVDLHGANLNRADVRRCSLDQADLTWADLGRSDLESATLVGADLTYVDLSDAKMASADFSRSICRLARLSGIEAHHANFTGANLDGAICYDAELQDANLSRTKLRGADLTRVKLSGAQVSGTEFGHGRRRDEDNSGGILLIGVTPAYTSLTQEQLDLAVVPDDCPPEIEHGTNDTVTGLQLVWKNQNVS